VLPARGSIDLPSIAAALLLAVLLAVAFVSVFGDALAASGRGPSFGAVVLLAVGWTVRWSLYALMGLVLLQAVLSWVNPDAPLAPAVDQLTRPFLAPIRKVVPLVGGFDLSPLVLFLVIQVLLAVVDPIALAF
jgi:YggT family protein